MPSTPTLNVMARRNDRRNAFPPDSWNSDGRLDHVDDSEEPRFRIQPSVVIAVIAVAVLLPASFFLSREISLPGFLQGGDSGADITVPTGEEPRDPAPPVVDEDDPAPTPTGDDTADAEPPTGNREPTPEPTPVRNLEGAIFWAAGDSFAVQAGDAIADVMAHAGASTVHTEHQQHPHGFADSSAVDWPGYLANEMATHAPDIAVLLVGANDAQDFPGPDVYREHVQAALDALAAEGRQVIVVGQPVPPPGRDDLREALPVMNAIFAEEAAARQMDYVDAWTYLAGPGGSYATHVRDAEGEEVRIRADDGVGLTREGAERLAEAVIGATRQPSP